MKKVVGIIGSLRKDSIHRVLFNQYKELAKEHFELVEGEIKDLPLFNQDIETDCPTADQLSELIHQADGEIFFSPEYNYSVPGALKNALDWVSRNKDRPFNNKPTAIVGASPGNLGSSRMQYHLRQIGVGLNMHMLNKPEVIISQAGSKMSDQGVEDESTLQHLDKHIRAFAETM